MEPANGDQVSGSFLTPLLISLGGVVATFLALIVYHWLLLKYCLRRRGEEDGRGGGFAGGVERQILETIPIVCFTGENANDQTECVICLGELKEWEAVRLLPNCRHLFHVPCIDDWFSAHSCCPICRTPVAAVTADVEHGGDRAASTSGVRSNVLLRHFVSLEFPRENKTSHLSTGLKRSLSMDQLHIYLIDDSGEASSSTSNIPQSIRQLDRLSDSLLRSFSQSQIGRRNGILPC